MLHSQQDRHPKVTRRTVSALETPPLQRHWAKEVEQREKPTAVRYRDPSTEEIVDDREMQRRFHTDEVIRREFDPEHDLPFRECIGELVLTGMLIVEDDKNEPLP